MKFAFAALSLALSPLTSTLAAPAEICLEQSPCLNFQVRLLSAFDPGATKCGEDTCTYEVCMIIDQDNPACAKADEFSHTCEKDEGSCVTSTGFLDAMVVESDGSGHEDISHGYDQCQYVAAGGTAEFLLKDGNLDPRLCHDPAADPSMPTFVRDVESGRGQVECLDSPYPKKSDCEASDGNDCSCTSSGGECMWKITVPDTCHNGPPPPTTTTAATTTTTVDATTPSTTTTVDATTTTAATTTTTTTAATTTTTTTTDSNSHGGGGGDPHFKRWNRERSTFHGECDLVMVHSSQFHNHAGLDLHARTTIDSYYSYIESAALRVGDYTLEMEKGFFYFEGFKLSYDSLPMTFGEEFKYTLSLGYNDKNVKEIKLALQEESSILFRFYKDYLTMAISGHPADFGDAMGLLGEFGTGNMYSRTGEPVEDFTTYGFEWQVTPDQDPLLFRQSRSPQLPYERCRMPTAARPARRMLRSESALLEQAKVACQEAHQGEASSDIDLCIDDVMTTGDIGLATAW